MAQRTNKEDIRSLGFSICHFIGVFFRFLFLLKQFGEILGLSKLNVGCKHRRFMHIL